MMEVSVGPKILIENTDKVSVVVAYNDRLNQAGAAVYLKIVMTDHPGEMDAQFTDRAAAMAKHLVDSMSGEISTRAYRARAGLHFPKVEDDEEQPGG